MTSARLLVGLDVGTTSAKAVVFTLDGAAVSTGRAPTPWYATALGTEMDAGALADAARTAVAAALAGVPAAGEVLGLGVTSMGESGVLLDPLGRPVAPVLAWHDDRDLEEVEQLRAEVGAEVLAEVAGLPLRRQWSLTKHRWQLRHQPSAPTAVRRLDVAGWVVRSLGGEEAADVSLASRTGWLDVARRDWWDPGLAFSGAHDSLMPALVTPGTALGRAGDDVARLAGAVLTTAGHDHQAAALGAGAAGPGDVLDSCGTAEALVRTAPAGLAPADVRALALAGTTVGWHVLPERWCLLAATEGGLAMQQVLRRLDVGVADLPVLDAEGATTERGAAWAGVVEEQAASAAGLLEAMEVVAGPRRDLVLTGGWSRADAVRRARERLLGPLRHGGGPGGGHGGAQVPGADDDEAGARGAALLAGRAAGVTVDDADGLPGWPS